MVACNRPLNFVHIVFHVRLDFYRSTSYSDFQLFEASIERYKQAAALRYLSLVIFISLSVCVLKYIRNDLSERAILEGEKISDIGDIFEKV